MGQFDHVVVVGYGRSAVAKSGKKGALRNMHPVTMGGLTLKPPHKALLTNDITQFLQSPCMTCQVTVRQ